MSIINNAFSCPLSVLYSKLFIPSQDALLSVQRGGSQIGEFCLVLDALHVVYITKNYVDHNLWYVCQQDI